MRWENLVVYGRKTIGIKKYKNYFENKKEKDKERGDRECWNSENMRPNL